MLDHKVLSNKIVALAQEFFLDFHDRKRYMSLYFPKSWVCDSAPTNLHGCDINYETDHEIVIKIVAPTCYMGTNVRVNPDETFNLMFKESAY